MRITKSLQQDDTTAGFIESVQFKFECETLLLEALMLAVDKREVYVYYHS